MKIKLTNGKIVEAVKNDELCAARYINKETSEYIYDDEIEKVFMFDNNILTDKGKQLSWLLRHDVKAYTLKGLIDHNGWRSVDEICNNYNYSRELLDEIVESNNKKRYEYNDDKTKIRARQGHSINVDVGLTELSFNDILHKSPFLYHGTSRNVIDIIRNEGLKPQSRQYVHLSPDVETAVNVGRRHGGKTCVITIDALEMKRDGKKIYISNNGVYNVDCVEPKYFVAIVNY